MNKAYKVVHNSVTGQYMVTSELAKGKTKSSSISNLLSKIAVIMGGAGVALSSAPAFADNCTTLANGTISCTQTSADEELTYNVTGGSSPISVNGTSIAGGEANVSITVTDSNITGAGGHGILGRGEGSEITLNGNNTITLGNADDTAVLSMGNYGSGGLGSITVNGHLDININKAGSTTADGLEAYGIDSNISHHGIGTITTNGGNAILTSATNNATVVVDGGAKLDVSGANNNGIKISANSGNVKVDSNARITTNGDSSKGIYAKTNAGSIGNISIENKGNISIAGSNSIAIQAGMSGTGTNSGKITINNTANIISNTGDTPISTLGHGIYGYIDNQGGDSGGIEINHTGGTIDTSGFNSTAIQAYTTAKTGDVNITVTDAIINARAGKSDGINVRSGSGATNVNQESDLDINITTNGGEINVLDGVAGSGETSNGIMAYQYAAAKGDINITNNGTKIKTGLGVDGLGVSGAAMDIRQVGTTATGNINVFNHGELSTAGSGVTTSAIYALNNGSGEINVLNTNTITIIGGNAAGIYAKGSGTGNVTVTNVGDIISAGSGAYGIHAYSSNGGDVTVESYANKIELTSAIHDVTVKGLAAVSDGGGNATVKATGDISVLGRATTGGVPAAIEARSSDGTARVVYSDGIAQSYGNTITAWGLNSATAKTGEIILGQNATVKSTTGYALRSVMAGGNTITTAQSANIEGYKGIQIEASQANSKNQLNHFGNIDVLTDLAVTENSVAGVTTNIDNYGTLTGFVTLSDEDTTFNNYSSNSFNIRNFADTDGDQVRDTKAVAISDFGLGNDTFKNDVTGVVRLAAVTGESAVDTTGEYVTAGALSISNAGIVQGQLMNLNTFENKGTIDLTENKKAGDILVISGGTTAGTNGGGMFVSNGGVLKLDTALNEGHTSSLSDLLVIDNSTAIGGATALDINVVSDAGQLTIGEGIKVIETLGTSSKNSFKLARPLISGLFEYVLGQGTADQNWYLTNMYDRNNPLFNPATGAYLANQTAASALFMHTLYDRQGHANNIAGDSEKKSSAWARVATSNAKNNSVYGNMGIDTHSNLIHLGGDVAKWQVEDGNLHLGLMGAYGQTDSYSKSKMTGTTAKGEVTGYSLGLYGTWFTDEAEGKGLYVDSWAQYGWYKNKVNGAGQNQEEKYDSNNWALSLEAGYGILLGTQDNTDIMLTPQVQVTYNNYSADDHQDKNNLNVTGSKANDLITRVGARLYGRAAEGYNAKPYIEANWLHHTAKNELSFNSKTLKDEVPKDRAETKFGLQGTISKSWKVWGQVGAQWGGNNYTRYEGQAGLNYQW